MSKIIRWIALRRFNYVDLFGFYVFWWLDINGQFAMGLLCLFPFILGSIFIEGLAKRMSA